MLQYYSKNVEVGIYNIQVKENIIVVLLLSYISN